MRSELPEISLAEAVAQSLAVIDAPQPEVIHLQEAEREAPQWSEEQYVCSGCGSEITSYSGISREYRESGTQYGGVNDYGWGLDFNVTDSDASDGDEDEYQCDNCYESSYQLSELVCTEKEYHENHDCEDEGCY